jgi:phosphomevalonate kinase
VVSKTGMGSSAALVTSLSGALLSALGAVRLPRRASSTTAAGDSTSHGPVGGIGGVTDYLQSKHIVHRVAQIAHGLAQGKVCSRVPKQLGV